MIKNSTLTYRAIVLIILLTISLIAAIVDNIYVISNIHFYVYLLLIILSIAFNKEVGVDIVWIVGFIYVIMSEMLFLPSKSSIYLEVVKYIIIGNNLILAAYYCSKEQTHFSIKHYYIPNGNWMLFLLLIFTILYFFIAYPHAVVAMERGRYYARHAHVGGRFGQFVEDFQYVLPALWAFCFRNKKLGWLWSLLLSSPVFICIYMTGTRFPLIFAFLGWVMSLGVINLYQLNRKSFLYALLFLLILIPVTNRMKEGRVFGYENASENVFGSSQASRSFSQKVASYGSDEGVVNANSWLFDYCNTNGYTYGKQSAFVFYWWFPRAYWSNKPEMTGRWLPHEYGNYRESHSSSIGIWGELYVDYGYYSFIFIFLWGLLLRQVNSYCKFLQKNYSDIHVILPPLLISTAFFAVRSPITSIISLCTSLVIYLLFRYLACKITL